MIILIIFIIAGLGCLVFQSYSVLKYIRAEHLPAVIVFSESNLHHVRNQYRFTYHGQVHTLWGPWHETLNPMESVFPAGKTGKETQIHLDITNMKILYLGLGTFVWIFIGFSMLSLGILGILVIYPT